MTQLVTKIESFTYVGKAEGLTLVVLGAVHGNEKCGTEALHRLKPRLDSGAVKLKAGKLIFIPITNPEAYAAGKRFLERNLNRSLYPKPPEVCKAYEDHLDSQICAVLDQADYLLDIHSYTVGGPPFMFLSGVDEKEKEFAAALGVTRSFVWGWSAAFKNSNLPEKDSWGTNEYARSVGARGVTLECGQHADPQNADVAYTAIMRAMLHLGLVGEATVERELAGIALPPPGDWQFAKMVTVIKNEPATLAKPFRHFEPVKKDQLLATMGDGRSITAAFDGFTILPNISVVRGGELVYLAVDEEPLPGKGISRKSSI